MAQETVQVKPGGPVTVKMAFKGVARYSAGLYRDRGGGSFAHVQALAHDGSSADARPDEFSFSCSEKGKYLFLFQANITAMTVPGEVEAKATVVQAGRSLKTVREGGKIDAQYKVIVVRIILEVAQ
jgi:hypothetical protein